MAFRHSSAFLKSRCMLRRAYAVMYVQCLKFDGGRMKQKPFVSTLYAAAAIKRHRMNQSKIWPASRQETSTSRVTSLPLRRCTACVGNVYLAIILLTRTENFISRMTAPAVLEIWWVMYQDPWTLVAHFRPMPAVWQTPASVWILLSAIDQSSSLVRMDIVELSANALFRSARACSSFSRINVCVVNSWLL